jgi:alkylation response protein AidB-like acyl-CoA dehydrogenase
MEEILALTVDYLKTRKQFGAEIGSFQALQHKAVDMFIEVEQAKSMAGYALSVLDAEPAERRLALVAAKAYLNACAKFVGETAVQLHGAIGMTIESKTGRLFQRLTRFQTQFGDRNHCTRELIAAERGLLEL